MTRADEALVRAGLASSLELSRALIMEGRVYVGEVRVDKPSEFVRDESILAVREKARAFVSRGGLKLEKALDAFHIDINGLTSIDIGSSTGGFTDVMLRRGARSVYAVDVGYGLLDWTLRSDARVRVMERTNARFLKPEHFDPVPEFGATDVSFISLKAVLPPALRVLSPGGRFVALIKPQFEARREQVQRGGVVRDRAVCLEVIIGITSFVGEIGWTPRAIEYSPITGAEGNIEFLLDIVPVNTADKNVTESAINDTIDRAYDNFMNSPD